MKHVRIPTLSAEQQAWLTDTFARNRAMYGGWRMKVDDTGGGDAGGADAGSGETGKDAGDKGDTGKTGDTGGEDLGYPTGTPVSQMTTEQEAAYWRHQARKHEQRNKEMLGITGGKSGDELKNMLTERETLLDAQRTDSEKAVEAARRETRQQTLSEANTNRVKDAFNLLLGDMPQEEKDEQLGLLNLAAFITDSGELDTVKVRATAGRIAPSGTDNEGGDYGQGRRGGQPSASVASGRSRYRERHGKSDKDA